MFGLSFIEVVAIAVIILIFVGPRQLPEVTRTIARFMNEFKRTTAQFSESFYSIQSEVSKTLDDTRDKLQEQVGLKDLQGEVKGLNEEVAKLNQEAVKLNEKQAEPSLPEDTDGDGERNS